MLPYLIAGAIGFAVAKIFEEDKAPKYADGGSLLLAPNGKPSNLTPEQYKLVRSPEFKAWFGDWQNDPANASKVIDENREPLVVLHGTNKEFNVFKIGSLGTYFSDKYEVAKEFGEQGNGFLKIIPVFLKIKKPFIKDYKGEDIGDPSERYDFELSIISNKKYDGSIYKNVYDSIDYETSVSNVFVAFDSTQIKLADGTNTTFDGNNPDIRFDGGGKVLSYNEVLKKQQTGDYYFDFLFSNENSKFIEETIDIRELRELNGFSDDKDEIEHTISYFNDLGMDEDYEIGRELMNKIVNGIELNPIVVDEEYKLLDGRHRLSAYSELYYYYSYDFPFDGKLKIYKRISN